MTTKTPTNGLKSNKIGNFAVGCVSYLVTQSGFVWRELPGFDIGIDGEIEVLPKGKQQGGKILVQVKGTMKHRKGVIDVNKAQSHWKYWRVQRSPVLVCEVKIEKSNGVDSFKATTIRWVDISRAPTDGLSSNSSIAFPKDNAYGIAFSFAEAPSPHLEWLSFISDVLSHWPTRRISAVLGDAYLLLHSGKPKEALASLSGLEEAVIDSASYDQRKQLYALKLKAERHDLPPRILRKKLQGPDWLCHQPDDCNPLIREIGYWHVIAAMDRTAERGNRVALADKALEHFGKLLESNLAEKLEKADYILYAAMIRHMCENSIDENRPKWGGAKRSEHLQLEHALQCYKGKNKKELIGESEAKRTLWRSHLLSGCKTRVQEVGEQQWKWFGKRRSSCMITAQDYQDAVMLKAWSYFVLSDQDTEDLSRARALLDAAIVGIRGCLPYYELDFWIAWIEDSYPQLVS